MTERELLKDKKRIVIKIGSSSLTHAETGDLNLAKIEKLVRVISDMRGMGKEVILVSSGAIATGRQTLGGKKPETVAEKQAYAAVGSVPKAETTAKESESGEDELKEKDWRAPLIDSPQDPDALQRMMAKTTARIGVGRCGPRLKTQTLLKLRADHAAARDAVMMDVSEELVSELGLFPVKTLCEDKNVFLTRPDLGRDFSEETKKAISEHCVHDIDVQIIVSDGLSSSSIEANAPKILPIVMEGLKEKGISTGTPIFVKFGRVAAQDQISELLNAKIVCSFIGERPGLATAESMSAYISYMATVGMPEARRTVVSNIHKNGVPAVEAGAYIVDLLALILEKKASGVDLKK